MNSILITDTSVLINFLAINRLDLLRDFPGDFMITEHVIAEVTDDFGHQQKILRKGISEEILTVVQVNTPEELNMFQTLLEGGRLGSGECSAIACAINRSYSLAIEDKRAIKEAVKFFPEIEIVKSQDIIAKLIHHDHLSIYQADIIKTLWETQSKFKLPFSSFKDYL